jgi:hypothetical protein
LQLPIVFGLADRLRLPRQRFARRGIVEVSGHEVDVQVWHLISEQLVIHVARCKDPLDYSRDRVNVAPVPSGFRFGQSRKVCDVTVSKDDDGVAASYRVLFEVCFA